MVWACAWWGVDIHGYPVRGLDVDGESRCRHYASPLDVIAIKFPCCNTYYPCYRCHEAVAEHTAERWPPERLEEPAVLCGACGTTLSIQTYTGATTCPACEAAFNPACTDHYHHYFHEQTIDAAKATEE